MRTITIAAALLCLAHAAHAQPDPAGRVFGEPIPRALFEQIRRNFVTRGDRSQDQVWRFIAIWKASLRAKVEVDPAAVLREVTDQLKFTVAQHRALAEVKRRDLDVTTPAGRQAYQQAMLRAITEGKAPTRAEQEAALRATRGVSLAEYTTQAKREALVQRYLERARAQAKVPAARVRAAWKRRGGARVVEVFELATTRFRPQRNAKPGTPGHVTEAELKRFYGEWLRQRWRTPRVRLEYLGVPFSAASKDEVAAIMDRVADAAQADPAASLKRLKTTVEAKLNTSALLHGELGPTRAAGLAKVSLLTGFSARRWLRTCRQGRTSAVLGGPKGWFVLRALSVQRPPSFAQARADVLLAYTQGDAKTLDARALPQAARFARALAVELEGADAARVRVLSERYDLTARPKVTVSRERDAIAGLNLPVGAGARLHDPRVGVGDVLVEATVDRKLVLLRLAKIEDPGEVPAEVAARLRERLRQDLAFEATAATLREAKAIPAEALRYVQQARGGARLLRLRQIVLAPDAKALEAWGLKAARKRLAAAQQALAQGGSFREVAARYGDRDDGSAANAVQRLPQFVATVRALKVGQISAPLRSELGLHLIRLVQEGKGQPYLRQLFVSSRPDLTDAPPELTKQAWAKAEERYAAAAQALKAGALFADVAREHGGFPTPRTVRTLTPLEVAALTHALRWKPDGIPAAAVPQPVEVTTPAGRGWHLFATARDHVLPDGRPDDALWHIRSPTRAAADAVRKQLVAWITAETARAGGLAPAWPDVLACFQALARKHSTAPTASKGGALGRLTLEHDPAFVLALTRLTAKPGSQHTVKTPAGYHLLRVARVTPDEGAPKRLAEALLDGTTWD